MPGTARVSEQSKEIEICVVQPWPVGQSTAPRARLDSQKTTTRQKSLWGLRCQATVALQEKLIFSLVLVDGADRSPVHLKVFLHDIRQEIQDTEVPHAGETRPL